MENRAIDGIENFQGEPAMDLVGRIPTVSRKVALIVVNYFSSAEVATMVESLATLKTDCHLAVSVVDNSCNEEEWDLLQRLLDPLRPSLFTLTVRQSESNAGFSAGNNTGYEALDGFDPDVVVIINPDVVVQHADFDRAIEEVFSSTNAIFGAETISDGRVLSGLGSLSMLTGRSRELLPGETGRKSDLVYPSGHFMAMRGDTWKALGGLSEDFFLFGEEADTVMRLRALRPNARVSCLADVVVSHTGGLTSGASKDLQKKSLVTFRHATRSSIILFRKHKPLRRWLPLIVAARSLFAVQAVFGPGPGAAKAILDGLLRGLTWQGRKD